MKDFLVRLKIAFKFIFHKERAIGYFEYKSHKNPNFWFNVAPEFPKYCKNIKWYPGLHDAIKINDVGEYFYNGTSHYYIFKSKMLISCWEIAARKEQSEFWQISENCL